MKLSRIMLVTLTGALLYFSLGCSKSSDTPVIAPTNKVDPYDKQKTDAKAQKNP